MVMKIGADIAQSRHFGDGYARHRIEPEDHPDTVHRATQQMQMQDPARGAMA